jgi:hypothetical protein
LVSISSPVPNSTLSGSGAAIAGSAQNNAVRVELYVDNILSGTGGSWTASSVPNPNLPYLFTLDTTTLGNGTHVVTMKAYDAAGDVGVSSPVPIAVSN